MSGGFPTAPTSYVGTSGHCAGNEVLNLELIRARFCEFVRAAEGRIVRKTPCREQAGRGLPTKRVEGYWKKE